MKLHELVPMVDLECDPTQDMDGCVDILLAEGWTFEQVGYWVKVTLLLKPIMLRMRVRARCN